MSVRIDISSLKEGSNSLEIFSSAGELNLNENLVKGLINIRLEMIKTASQLGIKIAVSGDMNLECDKCLENFIKPFTDEFELVYVQKSPRNYEQEDDSLRFYNPWTKYIDITDDVKQSVFLSIPMKCVPGENETGECVHCGKTKNYWKNILLDEEELNN